MTPWEYYQRELHTGHIQADKAQHTVMQQFEQLYMSLMQRYKTFRLPRFLTKKTVATGVYLWGPVGTGKTYLMDLFYATLPERDKARWHFHHFMQQIHEQLTRLQGKEAPLSIIAKQLARRSPLLFLDELFVKDIGDAMLLKGLLSELFKHDICLVLTSNHPPQELYQDGLQRHNFLPAIALLQQYLETVCLASPLDYRLRHLEQASVYFYPLNDHAKQAMEHCFQSYVGDAKVSEQPLVINQREIEIIASAGRVVWFDFAVLCNMPRSQNDYLAIAKQFDVLLLSHVIQIEADQDDKANYLINLIDILYEAHTLLIVSAEVEIGQLYPKGRLDKAFSRTVSRLQEMQSLTYLEAVQQKFES